MLLVMLGLVAFVGLMFAVAWASLPKCPACQKRTLRWLHQRKGGGPDLRFKENWQNCMACSWTTRPSPVVLDPPSESAAIPSGRFGLRPSPSAGAAAVVEEASEQRLCAVVLLRAVAVADRRFGAEEREAITRAMDVLFGADDALARKALAQLNESEMSSLLIVDDACARLGRHPAEFRLKVAGLLQEMTHADGRATPKETDVANRLMARLGAA